MSTPITATTATTPQTGQTPYITSKTLSQLAKDVMEVAIYVITGIFLNQTVPATAPALFTFAGTLFISRCVLLAVNTCYPYNVSWLNDARQKLGDFDKENSKVRHVALVIAVVLSLIWPIFGCAIAGILGILHAVAIETQKVKQ